MIAAIRKVSSRRILPTPLAGPTSPTRCAPCLKHGWADLAAGALGYQIAGSPARLCVSLDPQWPGSVGPEKPVRRQSSASMALGRTVCGSSLAATHKAAFKAAPLIRRAAASTSTGFRIPSSWSRLIFLPGSPQGKRSGSAHREGVTQKCWSVEKDDPLYLGVKWPVRHRQHLRRPAPPKGTELRLP